MTFARILAGVRGIAAMFIALLGVLTIGAFQGAEGEFGLSDGAAHAIAFYFLSLALFASAPRARRTDLAILAMSIGVMIEVLQLSVGRSASYVDLGFDGLGVVAAMIPTWVERLRKNMRDRPYENAFDRTRSRRRREAYARRITVRPSIARR